MISVEEFYKEKIEGKDECQIKTTIRRLKQEMGHLKKIMESPYYSVRDDIGTAEELVKINNCRDCIERSLKALKDMGIDYSLSKAEHKAMAFDESLEFIDKIIFSKGGYFEGFETITYRFDDEHLYMNVAHSQNENFREESVVPDYPISKKEFFEKFKKLHVGEWHCKYMLDGYENIVCDGTHWKLIVHFSNNHKPMEVSGNNCFPYNFSELEKLFWT